jgi:pimeloyl-ACP methyl ester carboxylesterase
VANRQLAADVAALDGELRLIQRQDYIVQQARGYRLGSAREVPFTLQQPLPGLSPEAPGTSGTRVGAAEERHTPLEAWLSLLFGPLTDIQQRLLAEMLAATTDAMLHVGTHLVTSHFPRFPVLCPVHAIHGSADRLMRPPLSGFRLVPHAGHALTLTHSQEVTTFLRETLCQ